MKNTLKNEKEIGNQKDESFEESTIEKFFSIIESFVEFVWGCFVASLGLGILYGIIYGLSYIGVACTVTATIWMVGCGAGAIIFGLVFLGNISLIHEGSSLTTLPELFLAMALVPGIFFVRALMFA